VEHVVEVDVGHAVGHVRGDGVEGANPRGVLIEGGADVSKARAGDGATPLYIACGFGHVAIGVILIEGGADVNMARTDNGATPLFNACVGGYVEVVMLLIKGPFVRTGGVVSVLGKVRPVTVLEVVGPLPDTSLAVTLIW
jgi:hypothetical protein